MNPIEMYRTAKIMANAMSCGMEQKLDAMIKNRSGEAPVNTLVMVFVIAILAGALLPVGISALKAANTSSWTPGEVATYGVITILLIIAVVLLIVRMATE